MGKRLFGLVASLVLLTGVAGCGGAPEVDVAAAGAVSIDRAFLDEAGEHPIVAIGEATHGNHEMAEVRRILLLRLAAEQGFRTFALEADFGGGEVVNDYVQGGPGSAADAARALGFDVYATTEMATLIDDLRAFNTDRAPKDRILYLTDVTIDTAPTYVVDRADHLGLPLITSSGKASYEKEQYPKLYEWERPVLASKGSLLLFVGDIVHRGSAYHAATGRRLAVFFNIHAAAAQWTDKHLWSLRPASPNWPTFRDLMVDLEPQQRHLFGFPPPGDRYWTPQTVGHLKELYPGIDTTPYATAPTGLA